MAHRKPLGTTAGLTYDAPDRDVRLGDVIQTNAGTCYRVIGEPRLQEHGKYAGVRWHLEVVRIGRDEVTPDDEVHVLHWYPRNKVRRAAS